MKRASSFEIWLTLSRYARGAGTPKPYRERGRLRQEREAREWAEKRAAWERQREARQAAGRRGNLSVMGAFLTVAGWLGRHRAPSVRGARRSA